MSETNLPSLEIGIRINTNSIAGSAQEVTSQLKLVKDAAADVGDETSKLGEGTAKLIRQLGNIGQASEVLRSISEISQGGTQAIAGEAMAVRLLGESFEGMIPVIGPILIAITTLVSLGAEMISRQEEHTDKLKEGAGAADAWKDSRDRAADAAKATLEAANSELDAYLKKQETLLQGEEKWAGYQQASLKATEAEVEATGKLTVQNLELQKNKALGAAGLTDGDKKAIEADFKAREATAQNGTADNVYQLKKQALQAQQAADEQRLKDTYKARDEANEKSKKLNDAADQSAQTVATRYGIKPEADGSYKSYIDQATKAEKIAQQKEREAVAAPGPDDLAVRAGRAVATSPEEVRAAHQAATAAEQKVNDLRAAGDARTTAKETIKLVDFIDKLTVSITDQTQKLNGYSTQFRVLEIDHDTANVKAQADAQIAANAKEADTQDMRRKTRDNNLASETNDVKSKLAFLPNDPALQEQLADLAKQAATNKHDDEQRVPIEKPVGTATMSDSAIQAGQLKDAIAAKEEMSAHNPNQAEYIQKDINRLQAQLAALPVTPNSVTPAPTDEEALKLSQDRLTHSGQGLIDTLQRAKREQAQKKLKTGEEKAEATADSDLEKLIDKSGTPTQHTDMAHAVALFAQHQETQQQLTTELIRIAQGNTTTMAAMSSIVAKLRAEMQQVQESTKNLSHP